MLITHQPRQSSRLSAPTRTIAGGALLLLPLVIVLLALLLVPLAVLVMMGLRGADGAWTLERYLAVLVNPRYRAGLVTSLLLASSVSIATVVGSLSLAVSLVRDNLPGASLIRALLTFPISFPGIVVGFMIIILFGRTGIVTQLLNQLPGMSRSPLAYTLTGLFIAYLYFELPRVTLTLTAALEQLDGRYEAAARSLGARPIQVFWLILLPLFRGPLIASAALAFATAMGAFGTAYTLAQRINILPIQIYDAFTVSFEFELASAMAVILALCTLAALALMRWATSQRPTGAGAV